MNESELCIIAERYGMQVNPNVNSVLMVMNGLERTGGYCPCVPKNNFTKDTVCPCKEMRMQHKCRCGLYVNLTKKEK